MRFVRARHLAIGFALYFGLVAYFASATARRTTGAWFTPAVSQMVYQTTMIGGIIVLLGLLAVASVQPHQSRSAQPMGDRVASGAEGGALTPSGLRSGMSSMPRASEESWEVEDILDDPNLDGNGYASPRRAEDAAAVSAALNRMQDSSSASASSALIDQLTEIRSREPTVSASEEGDLPQALVRLTEEMRPLLVAARDAGLDVYEVQRRFSQAMLGREGDLEYRVRLVERMKATLESALSDRASKELNALRRDLERAKMMTDQAHGAELAAAEAVALLDTGHHAAAFERTQAARRLLEEQISPLLPSAPRSPAPTAVLAFVGPAFAAAMYVAIAAMLLPGVTDFLEANYTLNTGVILFLSYGWLGLVVYALLSIFAARQTPTPAIERWEPVEDDF